MLTVSHSMLNSAQCLRYYKHKYVDRMETKEPSVVLTRGKVFHAYVETGSFGAIVDAHNLSPELRAVLIALAGNYKRIVATESKAEVKLTVDNFIPGANIVVVIDGEHTDEQGQFFLQETKTTTSPIGEGAPYWTKVHAVNPQADIYTWAELEHGKKPAYTLWDAVRIPNLKRQRATPIAERDFYKRATGTAAVGSPKPGTYLQDETFDQFTERLDGTIKANPEEFYHRETVISDESTIGETMAYVKLATRGLLQAHEENSFPCNKARCWDYNKPCEYLPVCTGRASIQDPELYQLRPRRETT